MRERMLAVCPLYNELAERLSERNIPILMHMDEDLKPLWDAIDHSRFSGVDSLSPLPDNDTSVAEAVALWPESLSRFNAYPAKGPANQRLFVVLKLHRFNRDRQVHFMA